MIATPYESFALARDNIGSTVKSLEQLYITNRLKSVEECPEQDNFIVKAIVEPDESIPYFYQPMTLVLPQKKTAIVIDLRPYLRQLAVTDSHVRMNVHNEQIFQLICNAAMIGKWRDDPQFMVSFHDVPLLCYGSLMAESLSRRVGLDAETTLKVMATFQIFYATRGHRNLDALTEEEKITLGMSLSRKLRVDLSTHKSILDVLTPDDLRGFNTIVNFIAKQKWSPRLNALNPKDMYTLIMNGWSGQGNPRETMMVAAEYPPTFLTLVYLCTRSTFYQKMPLGQIVKRLDRGNNLKGLQINIKSLINMDI